MTLVAPSFERDVQRLFDEFQALPGLTLTVPQVVRLLGVRERQASTILAELEGEGFLVRSTSGVYRRPRPSAS